MYRLILPLVLSGLALPSPSLAEDKDQSLYDFGKNICTRTMAEDYDDLALYAQLVPTLGVSNEEYCDCVGKAFVENAEEQAKLIAEAKPGALGPTRQKILWQNFEQCLPDVYVDPTPPVVEGEGK